MEPRWLGKLCAGPGMAPLCLLITQEGHIGAGSSMDETRAESAEPAEEDSVPAVATKSTSATAS